MISELSSRLPSPSGVFFSFSSEIRDHADVIRVDLLEVENAILALAVMRRRVERALESALGIHAIRRVASELEREHARDVRRKRQRLQIEHQLDVL